MTKLCSNKHQVGKWPWNSASTFHILLLLMDCAAFLNYEQIIIHICPRLIACFHKVAWVYTVDRYLTKYDCVTFNTLVNSLRSTDYAMKSSGWLLLDSAESLFVVSKQRVIGTQTRKENDSSSGLWTCDRLWPADNFLLSYFHVFLNCCSFWM